MMRIANARGNGISPAIRRRLTSTATSAVATVPPHSRTSAVWNAVRSTSIVVSPYVRLTRSMLPACSSLRPKALRVAIPRSMSTKNALIHRSSRKRRSVIARARPPMRTRNRTRIGPVTTRTSAVIGSIAKTTPATRSGTRTASARAGWNDVTYVSSASIPPVITLTSSPVRSPPA